MRRSLCEVMGTVLLVVGCGASESAAPSPALIALASSEAAIQMPADGNGNKQLISVSIHVPLRCSNGTVLDRSVEGWGQVVDLQGGGNNPNQAVATWNVTYTFANAAGDSWTFHEAVLVRSWTADDKLFLTFSGRDNQVFGTNNIVIGTYTIDLTTGERVFIAGQEMSGAGRQACARLG